MKKLFFCLFLFLGFLSPSFAAQDAWKVLEEIPVQQGGRIKPFQTFAIEAARQVTGKTKYEKFSAAELVWRWMAEPEKWNTTSMVPVKFRPIREEFPETMLIDNKLSPEILLGHDPFVSKVRIASEKKQRKEPLLHIERERISLYEKALLFRDIATGQTPGWIAHPEDPRVGWLPFKGFSGPAISNLFPAPQSKAVQVALSALLSTIVSDQAGLAEKTQNFKDSLDQLLSSRAVLLDRSMIKKELHYNTLKPFGWAWKLYVLALILFAVIRKKAWIPFSLLVAGFLMHTYGFYLRCMIAGRPPVSNMYESIIWVSWATVLFAIIIFAVYRASVISGIAAFVAAFALIISESFPVVLNPAISPLVPVLRSNLWLSVHVLTITLSYGAFALAWGLGHAVVFGYAFWPQNEEQNKNRAQYLYRAVQIGVILLAAGTVLGGVWANYSWGRFWGWDPKETWALIALLGYLAVLHGRLTGWIRTFGLGVGGVVSFLLVVMAWYGVNFVLAAGLHSYGFGGGGAPYVLAVCLADLALVGWAAFVYQKRQKSLTATPKIG